MSLQEGKLAHIKEVTIGLSELISIFSPTSASPTSLATTPKIQKTYLASTPPRGSHILARLYDAASSASSSLFNFNSNNNTTTCALNAVSDSAVTKDVDSVATTINLDVSHVNNHLFPIKPPNLPASASAAFATTAPARTGRAGGRDSDIPSRVGWAGSARRRWERARHRTSSAWSQGRRSTSSNATRSTSSTTCSTASRYRRTHHYHRASRRCWRRASTCATSSGIRPPTLSSLRAPLSHSMLGT